MTRYLIITALAVLAVLILAACGNGAVEEPEPTATNVPVATPTIAPTSTPAPTATAVPSPTPEPAATATSESETVAKICGYVNDMNDSEELVDTVEAFIEFAADPRTLALLPPDMEEKANLLVDVAKAYVETFHSGSLGEQAAKAIEPGLRASLAEAVTVCADSGF